MAYQPTNSEGRISGNQIVVDGKLVSLQEFAKNLGFSSWDEYITINPITAGKVNFNAVLDSSGTDPRIAAPDVFGQKIDPVTKVEPIEGDNQLTEGDEAIKRYQYVQGRFVVNPGDTSGSVIRDQLAKESKIRALSGGNITDIYKKYLPETSNAR
jgi:hypothetical protein